MTAETKKKIEDAIRSETVVLFMKGVPAFPQCGFSAQAVECLNATGVRFAAHDVLADRELRQGIKTFSQWPTIPQLYISGEFIGGCDIMVEMLRSGELRRRLEQAGAALTG